MAPIIRSCAPEHFPRRQRQFFRLFQTFFSKLLLDRILPNWFDVRPLISQQNFLHITLYWNARPFMSSYRRHYIVKLKLNECPLYFPQILEPGYILILCISNWKDFKSDSELVDHCNFSGQLILGESARLCTISLSYGWHTKLLPYTNFY